MGNLVFTILQIQLENSTEGKTRLLPLDELLQRQQRGATEHSDINSDNVIANDLQNTHGLTLGPSY